MTRRILVAAVLALSLMVAPAALAAPPETPDLQAASDSGSLSTDNNTNDTRPTFDIDAGVAAFGQTVTLCIVPSGTPATPTDYGSATVPASGVVQITASSALPSSYWVVTARTGSSASCTSGEVSESGLLLTVDTIAPLLAEGPTLISVIGADSTFTFTAQPQFMVFAEDGASVTLFEGTTARGTGTSISGIATITTSTALADGAHIFTSKATDIAGNVSGHSPATTFSVDATAPTAGAPDLVDDDGDSSSDNYTSNPRPRFAVSAEANAYVTIYENGIALGSAKTDGSGVATVSVGEVYWLDPGSHCLYAIATDSVGNLGAASADLCLTIAPGVAPFTSNLGVALAAEYLTLALRTSLPATATIRVLHKGKVVVKTKRKLLGGKRTKLELRLPKRARGAGRVVVVTKLKCADGRTLVVRRVARR